MRRNLSAALWNQERTYAALSASLPRTFNTETKLNHFYIELKLFISELRESTTGDAIDL